jgi:hypothetical protein
MCLPLLPLTKYNPNAEATRPIGAVQSCPLSPYVFMFDLRRCFA